MLAQGIEDRRTASFAFKLVLSIHLECLTLMMDRHAVR